MYILVLISKKIVYNVEEKVARIILHFYGNIIIKSSFMIIKTLI
jgi:hypothetical protein